MSVVVSILFIMNSKNILYSYTSIDIAWVDAFINARTDSYKNVMEHDDDKDDGKHKQK